MTSELHELTEQTIELANQVREHMDLVTWSPYQAEMIDPVNEARVRACARATGSIPLYWGARAEVVARMRQIADEDGAALTVCISPLKRTDEDPRHVGPSLREFHGRLAGSRGVIGEATHVLINLERKATYLAGDLARDVHVKPLCMGIVDAIAEAYPEARLHVWNWHQGGRVMPGVPKGYHDIPHCSACYLAANRIDGEVEWRNTTPRAERCATYTWEHSLSFAGRHLFKPQWSWDWEWDGVEAERYHALGRAIGLPDCRADGKTRPNRVRSLYIWPNPFLDTRCPRVLQLERMIPFLKGVVSGLAERIPAKAREALAVVEDARNAMRTVERLEDMTAGDVAKRAMDRVPVLDLVERASDDC